MYEIGEIKFKKCDSKQHIAFIDEPMHVKKLTVNNDVTAGRPRPYRFLRCDWLQPRATSQKNEHVYFWSQSHRSCVTVIIVNDA